MGDLQGTLQSDNDDNSLKTKITLTRFGGTFGVVRFDGKSFFNTFLSFTPYSDPKPTNAIHTDSSGAYTSEKLKNQIQ